MIAVAAIRYATAWKLHTAARVGGEEFALLLPGTGRLDAAALAERVRGAIGRESYQHLMVIRPSQSQRELQAPMSCRRPAPTAFMPPQISRCIKRSEPAATELCWPPRQTLPLAQSLGRARGEFRKALEEDGRIRRCGNYVSRHAGAQ